jgi:outer membrane lipoprotein-sorting protein
MRFGNRTLFTALLALVLLPSLAAQVADEKDRVLRKLDASAKNFHSTAAEFEYDAVTTDPLPDKTVEKGSIYYERTGKVFRMAGHVRSVNDKPVVKTYTYVDGAFSLFEGGNINQVTTYAKASQFESYMMLGFGASGQDLEKKWDIKYLGPETLDGVKTDKLELVAKDPAVRKTFPKITVWMDTDRGISLKQVFDEGAGQYRVGVYFKIKVNQPLPSDAFTMETNHQTTYVKR